ncbi:putative polypeptide N-acetylgalactosaminyltransferase 13 [Episyrphus balteatus]|uniref:putative polypeptide N-acetylgalactosaminyltransferase 13 n=1 Tax=Episyrphus balteatus TaxID=286459 RepID=UPI002485A7E3|nr:putative polypeptide N-acetylgalactosaminyltransferase 13 [Episyrphus balteatus]
MGGLNRKKKYLLLLVLILSTVFFVIQITVQLERESSTTLNIGELKILANLSALSGEFEGFIFNRMVLVNSKKKSDFYFFEKYITDGIGAFRELPDTRDEVCKERLFNVPKKSKVSVIIVFRNEARSTLLRTIVSVLQRTPQRFLNEIIVIDDFSDDETILTDLVKLPFEGDFIKSHRNRKHNKGLIESRNLRAKLATGGDYIVFLDSHSEVNVGWIVPLLDRLASYPAMAVSPVLDSIDATTFQYLASSKDLKGGFDWNLHFRWIPIGEEEREAKNHPSNPFTNIIFFFGVLISRNWFFKLNGFNPLLKGWGGESIEMSIKLWLCGGQIEIVPCSRVGHVFQRTNKQHPQDLPNEEQHLRNRKVIAESWLDEYKYFFFTLNPSLVGVADVKVNGTLTSSTGHDNNNDIRSRRRIQRIKKDGQCRPFSWFLLTIFQELKLPNSDYIAFGKLSSGGKCLKTVSAAFGAGGTFPDVVFKKCYHGDASYWFLSKKDGRLVSDMGTCLSVGTKKSNDSQWPVEVRQMAVVLEECNNAKSWMWKGGKLIYGNTQMCLDNRLSKTVTMTECRRGVASQLFRFSVGGKSG